MTLPVQTVVGIDVGGVGKGFHAVALRDGVFKTRHSTQSAEIVAWCVDQEAKIIAVDAPSGWSQSGPSREAEKNLRIAGEKIHCFSTPTKDRVHAHTKGFYDWVFNGKKLYQELISHSYPLFDGENRPGPLCFETFPHAIVCAIEGRVVKAKPKTLTRRAVLRKLDYDDSCLPNIDFVDAALCAIAAEKFRHGRVTRFGRQDEGFIVIPAIADFR